MHKFIYIVTLSFLLTIPTMVLAEYATTDNGKRVILDSNGTWSFWKEKKIIDSEMIYIDEVVQVSLSHASIVQNQYSKIMSTIMPTEIVLSTEVVLNVKIVSQSKIINPKTHRVYGYEDGSDIGGTMPSGFSLSDNFGNDLKVTSVSPQYTGYKERGLRPNETKKFTLKTADYPIETATFIKISINKSIFGNKNNIILKIPMAKVKKYNRVAEDL